MYKKQYGRERKAAIRSSKAHIMKKIKHFFAKLKRETMRQESRRMETENFYTSFGGLDEIVTTMNKLQKLFIRIEQMTPMFNMFDVPDRAVGVRSQTNSHRAKGYKHDGKQAERKEKNH